jgi:hypothetical protein
MMNFTVQVGGLDTLSLGIRAMYKPVQDGLAEGVRDAALIFKQEAQTVVPVKTGRLQSAIHDEVTIDEPERQERAVLPAYETGGDPGFEPPYARRIEFGFIGTDSLGRKYHQAAQPYMRPAWDSKEDEARQAIKDALNNGLELAAERLSEAARRR